MKAFKESKTTSFLSKELELKGHLYIKGGIRIDGKITGTLKSDSTIFVGDTGVINANISTLSIVSSGVINGKILAKDTVKIDTPGTVNGDIETSSLRIEKNVFFNGKCQILSPPNNHPPKQPTPKSPRQPIPHRK